jgi:prevent-host-death family protein
MRIAPLADVKARLSAYIQQSETEGPVVITRNGKAVAVLVAPIDDDDVENLVLARSPRLQRLLGKSRASIQAGQGLSSKDFWKAVSKSRNGLPQTEPPTAETSRRSKLPLIKRPKKREVS